MRQYVDAYRHIRPGIDGGPRGGPHYTRFGALSRVLSRDLYIL